MIKNHTKTEDLFNRFLPVICGLVLLLSAGASKSTAAAASTQGLSLEEKLEAEQRLAELGYWNTEIDGVLDGPFRHALTAFQKVEGRERTGRLTMAELQALRSAVRPRPRYTGTYHIEIDLTRQVLFVVEPDGFVSRILPVCTGNDRPYTDAGRIHRAYTPRGNFKVIRKIDGWRRSSLGLLYYPNYIVGGVAIHGSPVIHTEPASHGCIRIPLFASKEFSQLTPVGTEVMVYD